MNINLIYAGRKKAKKINVESAAKTKRLYWRRNKKHEMLFFYKLK